MMNTKIWNITDSECALEYACDRFVTDYDDEYYRGMTVYSSPEILFRWLCQMRVAPYSYDWIDNLGRQSPRKLTPGLDNLAVGQDVMFIFEIVVFTTNRQITVRIKERNFGVKTRGDGAMTYMIVPVSEGECRLLVKIRVTFPGPVSGFLWNLILPPGDLIMMRKQLLNFKKLAERDMKFGNMTGL